MICIKGSEIRTSGSDEMLATNLTCLYRYFQKTNPKILRVSLEAFQALTDKYSEACKLFEEA